MPPRPLTFASCLVALSIAARAVASPPQECSTAAPCKPKCDQVLAELNAPLTGSKTTFTGHECMTLGTAVPAGSTATPTSTVGCACKQSSSFMFLGKGHGTNGCLRSGRDHSCLYKESEFPGCSLEAKATSCEAVCKDLEARIQKDEGRGANATLKEAACARGSCACVTKIGDGCYLEPFHDRYDCSLSAEKIYDTRYPTTPAPEPSGSPTGSSSSSSSGCNASGGGAGGGLLALALAGITAIAGARRRAARPPRA